MAELPILRTSERWKGDNVSYSTRHRRVQKGRGPAAAQKCVDCGESATDWSQIKGTKGAIPEHFEPRCRTCHIHYDGKTKLCPEDVLEIKQKIAEGMTQRVIASIYGVHHATIADIASGRSWANVRITDSQNV